MSIFIYTFASSYGIIQNGCDDMFKIGEYIKIKNSNLRGIISNISYKDGKELFIIIINNKKIKINSNNIEKDNSNQNPKKDNTNKLKININSDYLVAFVPELMIRHQNLDIAMFNVENFVNEAIINNCKEIKIIHGRHGGILKSGVHEYLKHNKNVESFRLGNYFEGSYGVTIVKLK